LAFAFNTSYPTFHNTYTYMNTLHTSTHMQSLLLLLHHTSLTTPPLFGISVSTISNPLRLGYLFANLSTSHSSSPGPSGFSLRLGAAFVGEVALPPVCSFFGLGGRRGAGPDDEDDGARMLTAGGADAEGIGGGMVGRMDAGFAYVMSCWLGMLTGLRAMVGGWRIPDWS
jgi:hypothetical protein